MINAVAIVLLVLSSRVPDRHDPDALGAGQRPVRHVRRLQQPLGRYLASSAPSTGSPS